MSIYRTIDKIRDQITQNTYTNESIEQFYQESVEIFELFDKALSKQGFENHSTTPETNSILKKIKDLQEWMQTDPKPIKLQSKALEMLSKINKSFTIFGLAFD